MSKQKEALAKWRESLAPALGSDFNGLDQEALYLVELAWKASRKVALEDAAAVIELYDDATMKADYMLDSTECAGIIRELKEQS
jgi:hypothetical protein